MVFTDFLKSPGDLFGLDLTFLIASLKFLIAVISARVAEQAGKPGPRMRGILPAFPVAEFPVCGSAVSAEITRPSSAGLIFPTFP